MKKLIKYSLALLLGSVTLFGVTACSEDDLDIQQRGVSGTDTYVTGDSETINQFMAAIYARYHGDYSLMSGSFGGDGSTSWPSVKYLLSKMADEETDPFKYMDSSESDTYSQPWSFFYQIAYWCNMIITNVPGNNVASAETKTRVIAEARAMRALSMMYLTQLYGNVPLADHVLTGGEGNSPAADNWAWIEEEFEEAAKDLPSKGSIDGQAAIGGRFTKEACYAYEGKAQLWQGEYAEAAETLNKVISTGYYDLEDNFDDLNLSKSDFGKENIFEYNFDDATENVNAQDGYMDIYAFGCNQVMCYGAMNFPLLYLNWGLGSNPTESFYNFMVEHDGAAGPRMTGSISTAAAPDFAYCSNLASALPLANNMGYFRIKNITRIADKVGAFPMEFSKKNLVYLRYAEVLLDYAEAVCNGGGDQTKGLNALNKVRKRAGLADAPSLDMNNATYGIKAERRAELYNEGARYIDCVRWGDAATAFANVGKYIYNFTGEGAPGAYTTTKTETGGPGWKSGKNELFPIPQSDINQAGGVLKQNPGW